MTKTVLITGGNTGLGFESARRLKAAGFEVYITSRSEEKGAKAAAQLAVHYLVMDVTDEKSVELAAEQFGKKAAKLDVLINNAGIPGEMRTIKEVDAALMERVFNTNVFGIVRTTQAFLPYLEKAATPIIVNVSSGVGSFSKQTDPKTLESKVISPAYAASKAAVSMLTLQYAKALPNMRVNAVDPGPTNTGGNFKRGAQNLSEGTDAIFKMATLSKDGPTGTFVDRNGILGW